jgi:hypothetical protein
MVHLEGRSGSLIVRTGFLAGREILKKGPISTIIGRKTGNDQKVGLDKRVDSADERAEGS